VTAGENRERVAVIAGAGPAGLTAALELLRHSDIRPLVIEADTQVGGISKTICYRGNRIDLGGHRFFSKSDWVMKWWQEILPLARTATQPSSPRISYQGQSRDFGPEINRPSDPDAVMLLRQRLSRIFYRRKFFDYPLALTASTVKKLGIAEAMMIGASYARTKLAPRSPEASLEDFFINRFGSRLYHTFFRDYTQKVWGVPCADISAEWGVQRIKGLSVAKAIRHSLGRHLRAPLNVSQRHTETSLIERFLYPKFGPGQMWEEVSRQVIHGGGRIEFSQRVVGVEHKEGRVTAVSVLDTASNSVRRVECQYFISTIPVRDLVAYLMPDDARIVHIARELPYRDFMTVGLLMRQMRSVAGVTKHPVQANGMPPDNWIYIQEPDVKIGRLQVFNNWSPALVADPRNIWLGLEYFCREGDDLWSIEDGKFIDFAARELEKIGLIYRDDVLDGTLVRVPKAYPAYFGAYREFDKLQRYLNRFPNLYPIGRNGMHRYNNQDHSMLAARSAVESIVNASASKADIWRINSEDEYHEESR
jgi:protoporphyrinogen oxidase